MSEQLEKPTSRHRKFAELLDSKFRIPNTDIRFGIDPLLGLVPGAGDWLGAFISLYFLFQAVLLGGRAAVLGRMFINILLDLLIGSIPVIGDLFDVYWKANERNAAILDELKQDPQKTATESRFWVWTVFVQLVVLVVAVLWLIAWILAELLSLLF